LAGLYKKYSEQGLQIVGLECQNSTAAEIQSFATSKGIKYQCTTGGELSGAVLEGIPHTYLLGPDGALAGENMMGKLLDDKIKTLLLDSSTVFIGDGPYKKLAQLAAQAKTGQYLGQTLKTLRTKKDSKDADEASEAKMMYDAIYTSAQEAFDGAVADKDSNPLSSIARFEKLTVRYAGDELATNSKKEADALKKDPKVKKEMEADEMWKKVELFNNQMKAFQGQRDPKNEGFRKINAQTITILLGGCQQLIQRYPNTAAAAHAEELASEYR
jgi:hypothetical protein